MSYAAYLDRPIAITDLETTGLDSYKNEIVEMGLVLMNQRTLEVIGTWERKVLPTRMQYAHPKALEVNGYTDAAWKDAVPLTDAMREYAAKTAGAIFAAYNVTFDWPFMQQAFANTGVQHALDYHRMCLFSIAWDRLRDAGLSSYSLDGVSRHFGLPDEARPHRALNGARRAAEVYQRLHAAGHGNSIVSP